MNKINLPTNLYFLKLVVNRPTDMMTYRSAIEVAPQPGGGLGLYLAFPNLKSHPLIWPLRVKTTSHL